MGQPWGEMTHVFPFPAAQTASGAGHLVRSSGSGTQAGCHLTRILVVSRGASGLGVRAFFSALGSWNSGVAVSIHRLWNWLVSPRAIWFVVAARPQRWPRGDAVSMDGADRETRRESTVGFPRAVCGVSASSVVCVGWMTPGTPSECCDRHRAQRLTLPALNVARASHRRLHPGPPLGLPGCRRVGPSCGQDHDRPDHG